MAYDIQLQSHQVLVILSGELQIQEVLELGDSLQELVHAGRHTFQFQMDQVTFLDSNALRMLVTLHKQALEKGGSVSLHGLQGVVRELFEITRLSRVFDLR